MRVIEPSQLKRRSIKKKRSKLPLFIVLAIVIAAGVVWKIIEPKKIDPSATAAEKTVAVTESAPTVEEKPKDTLKTFTNQEFVNFYTNFAYPNTFEISTPPLITALAEADIRIRSLAESRGYKLRSAPISAPVEFVKGFYLQQKAVQPYNDMVAAAAKEGHDITLTAAFRSVEEQRTLFNERLAPALPAIAAGTADDGVINTLKITAPPGYSRHHNGFTVDIACGNIGGMALLETGCYAWLSKDNFKNAKEYGWIPSYPDGVNSIGPEPEPWEFVWVGRSALLE